MSHEMDTLRRPFSLLDLFAPHGFATIEVHGLSLAVDQEAHERIEAATSINVVAESVDTDELIERLVQMLAQDRVTPVGDAVVAAFKGGQPTKNDGRAAENLAHFSEADLACQVVAADVLADIGPRAVPALTTALGSPANNRRGGAARALGQMGPAAASAVSILKDLATSDPAETVRGAAAKALSLIQLA